MSWANAAAVWATVGLSVHMPAGLIRWQVSAAIPVANEVYDANCLLFGLKVAYFLKYKISYQLIDVKNQFKF